MAVYARRNVAVDIYDTVNKLVGFHVLLSPGHRALRTVGLTSCPVVGRGGNLIRGGRASGVVLTSGGSIVTLTGECLVIVVCAEWNYFGSILKLSLLENTSFARITIRREIHA